MRPQDVEHFGKKKSDRKTGRPRKEQTVVIRVPLRLVDKIKELIKKESKISLDYFVNNFAPHLKKCKNCGERPSFVTASKCTFSCVNCSKEIHGKTAHEAFDKWQNFN